MRKILSYLIIVTVLVSTGCKKDSDNSSNIYGKWKLDRWTSKETYSGTTDTDGDIYPAGDYLQFESNGTCIAKIDGDVSNTTYELRDNGKTLYIDDNGNLDVPAEGFEIIRLTSSALELYSKETDRTSTYEITIFLSK